MGLKDTFFLGVGDNKTESESLSVSVCESESDVVNLYNINIPLWQQKPKRNNTMLLGLDASTRVDMGLDANPCMDMKRTLSSTSASGFPLKQQDDGNKKEAISTLSSAASNSEKKERIVVKINLSAWRKRKAQKEELKLEASKRKLQLGYQQVQKAKRKIQLVDLRDIPKPETECRS